MSLENMTLEEIQFWSKSVSDTLNEIEKEGLYRCPECKKLIVGRPCDWNICGSGQANSVMAFDTFTPKLLFGRQLNLKVG